MSSCSQKPFYAAAVYDCRMENRSPGFGTFFQSLAKSLTAKSWGEEPQSDGLAAERKTVKREINPGAYRDATKRQS
jgi:hypothetical protein